ncbi:translation initiation factor IF-2-like [Chiroxiphia lanceolata]|uniref:translation initiation factor IF-2-like n=1 Tax=Chiroxiphia lanceolata TaxID=296741 RepID=UPI0013CF34CA|nr:translation initiation factor IF-2-like [Chiroxiphia lanceolata]
METARCRSGCASSFPPRPCPPHPAPFRRSAARPRAARSPAGPPRALPAPRRRPAPGGGGSLAGGRAGPAARQEQVRPPRTAGAERGAVAPAPGLGRQVEAAGRRRARSRAGLPARLRRCGQRHGAGSGLPRDGARRAAAAVVVVVSASAARAAEGPAGPLAAELDARDAGLRRVGGEVLEAAAAAAAAARGEPLAVREAGKPCRELLFSSPPSFAFPLLPPPPPHQNRERRRVRCLAAPVLLGLLLQGFVRGVVGFCCFVFAFFLLFHLPRLLPSSLLAHCMLGSGWILPFIFGCASRKGEGELG